MRAERLILILAVVVVLVAVVGYVFLFRPSHPEVVLRPDDANLVTQGKTVYAAYCAVCHGAKLEGQPNWKQRGEDGKLPAPPHDETGHTWHHDDTVLFIMTKHGLAALTDSDYPTNMPAYADVLSDTEIVAVLSYIKSTWPAEIRTRHDQLNERVRAQR